ncbi:GlxA family transcriptional regulator [Marivita sp. S6314]|uniref:GlxA family transcriptional regulator n=1 Tax=Marivita sp. S6314 TaxID=2926406 RepID=UPI001FF17719|nr:GlxA family transcriptional regulator [Marivita sp. S6314]MCK0151181.1 GlxA family transcriptional regulator [Marivita sp. S6314]
MHIPPSISGKSATGFPTNHALMVITMLIPPKSPEDQIKIAYLLVDRFSNLCLSNALEPLRAANGFAAQPVYTWHFYSLDGAPVRSSSGLQVMPDGAIGGLSHVDRLYVISSYGHLENDTPHMRRALQAAARKADRVFGLDAGAWLLASSGLLKGRKATIHWDILDAFSERFLDVTVEHATWIADRDVLTCAGASATLELSRHLIAEDISPAIALDVDGLFTPPVRSETLPAVRDSLVARATRLMRENVEAPLRLDHLADALNTSPRTLTRRCQSALGMTPGQLCRHIRLSAARHLVESSTLSISEIAVRCGYEDPTALTRAFRTRFGAAPRAFRGETAIKQA